MSGQAQKQEAWRRLVKGLRPSGFDPRAFFKWSPYRGPVLSSRDGRLDLTGLVLPEPERQPVLSVGGDLVSRLSGVVELRGVRLRDLDLSGARLPSLRFMDCVLENCLFAGAECPDWRMWGTTIRDSSFERADLCDSALGATREGTRNARNRFHSVSFDRADLRGTAWQSAEMRDCSFRKTNLRKVEFNGTVFEHCVFTGRLEEVMFHRRAFRGERFPPNELQEVDFTQASFHWVEFRDLDLETVRFPERPDHLVIDDYPARLDRLLQLVEGRADLPSRRLHALFAATRGRVGAHQRRGVVNLGELAELAGPELLPRVLRVLTD